MESILGEIKLFTGQIEPMNYVFCDGRLLDINSYNSLYEIIGTKFGGDGETTFAIPNLKYSDDIKYIICLNGS